MLRTQVKTLSYVPHDDSYDKKYLSILTPLDLTLNDEFNRVINLFHSIGLRKAAPLKMTGDVFAWNTTDLEDLSKLKYIGQTCERTFKWQEMMLEQLVSKFPSVEFITCDDLFARPKLEIDYSQITPILKDMRTVGFRKPPKIAFEIRVKYTKQVDDIAVAKTALSHLLNIIAYHSSIILCSETHSQQPSSTFLPLQKRLSQSAQVVIQPSDLELAVTLLSLFRCYTSTLGQNGQVLNDVMMLASQKLFFPETENIPKEIPSDDLPPPTAPMMVDVSPPLPNKTTPPITSSGDTFQMLSEAVNHHGKRAHVSDLSIEIFPISFMISHDSTSEDEDSHYFLGIKKAGYFQNSPITREVSFKGNTRKSKYVVAVNHAIKLVHDIFTSQLNSQATGIQNHLRSNMSVASLGVSQAMSSVLSKSILRELYASLRDSSSQHSPSAILLIRSSLNDNRISGSGGRDFAGNFNVQIMKFDLLSSDYTIFKGFQSDTKYSFKIITSETLADAYSGPGSASYVNMLYHLCHYFNEDVFMITDNTCRPVTLSVRMEGSEENLIHDGILFEMHSLCVNSVSSPHMLPKGVVFKDTSQPCHQLLKQFDDCKIVITTTD